MAAVINESLGVGFTFSGSSDIYFNWFHVPKSFDTGGWILPHVDYTKSKLILCLSKTEFSEKCGADILTLFKGYMDMLYFLVDMFDQI